MVGHYSETSRGPWWQAIFLSLFIIGGSWRGEGWWIFINIALVPPPPPLQHQQWTCIPENYSDHSYCESRCPPDVDSVYPYTCVYMVYGNLVYQTLVNLLNENLCKRIWSIREKRIWSHNRTTMIIPTVHLMRLTLPYFLSTFFDFSSNRLSLTSFPSQINSFHSTWSSQSLLFSIVLIKLYLRLDPFCSVGGQCGNIDNKWAGMKKTAAWGWNSFQLKTPVRLSFYQLSISLFLWLELFSWYLDFFLPIVHFSFPLLRTVLMISGLSL